VDLAGGEGVDLAGLAVAGGDLPGDLAQADVLALAGAFGDVQVHGGVGESVFVGPAAVIGAGDGSERGGGQVRGGAFAVGEHVEPGGQDAGEQGR
jgi:hypothetical protein